MLLDTVALAEERAIEASQAQDALNRMQKAFEDSQPKPEPKRAPKAQAYRVYYPDDLFVDALNGTFRSAGEIHRSLLKVSPVSRASIHARLKKLAADPRSQVEELDGNSWRRKQAKAVPLKRDAKTPRPTRRKSIKVNPVSTPGKMVFTITLETAA
jgi:hypothetical protein